MKYGSSVVAVVTSLALVSPCWAGLLSSTQGKTVELVKPLERRQDSPLGRVISTPVDKLGRGLTNVLASPHELVLGVRDMKRNHGWVMGVMAGPFSGLWRVMKRLSSGTIDVVTFPFPPKDALFVQEDTIFSSRIARRTWVYDEADVARDQLQFFTVETGGALRDDEADPE